MLILIAALLGLALISNTHMPFIIIDGHDWVIPMNNMTDFIGLGLAGIVIICVAILVILILVGVGLFLIIGIPLIIISALAIALFPVFAPILIPLLLVCIIFSLTRRNRSKKLDAQ